MSRKQETFVLFPRDFECLAATKSKVEKLAGIRLTSSAILRLAIRCCPLDELNINRVALEVIQDTEKGKSLDRPRLKKASCMLTPEDQVRLEVIRNIVTPVLRSKISLSMIGRIALRSTSSSLIITQKARDVYYDDYRRSKFRAQRTARRAAKS